ncbi:MAG: hypothetical protein GWP69_21355 [Gammaproteobacteria bacterium]|nr:hypothetical protein [Gammaproteobacteria bacterium]
MNRRFIVLAAAVCGMLLVLSSSQAADTLPVAMNLGMKDVSIQLATGRIQPGEFNLKVGEPYRFVIVNRSDVNHSLSAPGFAGTALISDVESMNIMNGMVIHPGERTEWHLTPLMAGTYKFGCAYPAHAAAGMEATIHVF